MDAECKAVIALARRFQQRHAGQYLEDQPIPEDLQTALAGCGATHYCAFNQLPEHEHYGPNIVGVTLLLPDDPPQRSILMRIICSHTVDTALGNFR